MNTHEIAEITAELSRRGLTGQCRIRLSDLRTPTRLPDVLLSGEATTIYNDGKHFATISRRSDGAYRAYKASSHHGHAGNSKAEALANLPDEHP